LIFSCFWHKTLKTYLGSKFDCYLCKTIYLIMKKKKYYKRKCKHKYNRKVVYQYSERGQFIREWKTVGEVFRELGFDKSAILRCCNGKQHKSYHYIWKFKDDVLKANKKEMEKQNESNSEKLPEIFLEIKTQT